jgi:hypothetical protein
VIGRGGEIWRGAFVRGVDEVVVQEMLGAADAALHRRERATGEARDRFEIVALDGAQGPRDAVVGRQGAQEGVNLRDLRSRVRGGVGAGDGVEVHRLGAFAHAEDAEEPLAAHAGADRVDDDGAEPGAEGAAIGQVVEALEGAEEGVVGDVLHVVRGALDPRGEVDREGRVATVEELERMRVPLAAEGDELGVRQLAQRRAEGRGRAGRATAAGDRRRLGRRRRSRSTFPHGEAGDRGGRGVQRLVSGCGDALHQAQLPSICSRCHSSIRFPRVAGRSAWFWRLTRSF